MNDQVEDSLAIAMAKVSANGNGKTDPGVDPVELAGTRMKQLVGNAADEAIVQLTAMRDEIDQFMGEIRSGGDALQDEAVEYVRKIKEAIQAKVIIGDALSKLRASFGTASGAQITQQPQGS